MKAPACPLAATTAAAAAAAADEETDVSRACRGGAWQGVSCTEAEMGDIVNK
jgi:hypothetical protein